VTRGRRVLAGIALPVLALLAAALSPAARAQDVRPGDQPLPLPPFLEPPASGTLEPPRVPDFLPPERAPGAVLPPLEPRREPSTEGLEGGETVTLREIRVRGATALPPAELDAIALPYLNRPLDFADLQRLRDALTAAYVDRGFVTSGAVVPPQSVAEGELEVWIVEGSVREIQVEMDGRLRPSYVRDRLALAVGPPVNVQEVERALQVLQQDERIARVNARLVPTEQRGEALLRVQVREAFPFHWLVAGNNYNTPAIGSGRGEVRLSYDDVTGFGDAVLAEYRGGIGLQDVRGQWEWPVSPWDTRVDAHFRLTWSDVVEDPFDDLDIRSKTRTYGFRVAQPLYRTSSTTIGTFLIGEYRESKSYLFNDLYSFVPGPDDGVVEITVLRLGAEGVWRSPNQVLAARTLFSQGLPWLGATSNSGHGVPDDDFFVFLGQLQAARRLPDLFDVELVGRLDAQIAKDPLFALEQYATGGHDTVRGYRENALVRDSAIVASAELRVPIPLPALGPWRPRFALAPFFDYGYSWNVDRDEAERHDILSVGLGGRLQILAGLDFEIYWGHELRSLPTFGSDHTLQDDGIGLGITWRH